MGTRTNTRTKRTFVLATPFLKKKTTTGVRSNAESRMPRCRRRDEYRTKSGGVCPSKPNQTHHLSPPPPPFIPTPNSPKRRKKERKKRKTLNPKTKSFFFKGRGNKISQREKEELKNGTKRTSLSLSLSRARARYLYHFFYSRVHSWAPPRTRFSRARARGRCCCCCSTDPF